MIALTQKRGACPALSTPMQTGDGLLVRLNPIARDRGAEGLSPCILIGLCHAASRHGNGIIEVTQRGSIQIRGLTQHGAAELAAEVDTLGIAVRTGVPVETGSLAGLDPDEIADPGPLADAIRAAVENARLSRRLGPKVSVVVDGGGRIDMDGLLADVRLRAVRQDGETFWRCAVGGPAAIAWPVGLFSEADAVTEAIALLEAIAELGLEGRGRHLEARTFESLRSVAPGRSAIRRSDLSGLGIFPLSNATHALAIALPFGSMPAGKIAELAQAVAGLDAAQIRPAPGRMLLILDLTAKAAAALQAEAAALGFVTDAADPRLCIAACPGQPACASGYIGTRPLAGQLARQAADLFDGSFTLHISGCDKGCAHPGRAMLTLVGGENGAGLVVEGTAKALAADYSHTPDAGLGRIAALVREARRADETVANCLARLGADRIETAFAQE